MQKQPMKNEQRSEFDDYIKQYRQDRDSDLALSGHSSQYFAEYKIKKMIEWLPELLAVKRDILDFGCGDGLTSTFVSKHLKKSRIYGADPSKKSIEIASEQLPEGMFKWMSDDTIPFDDYSFDLTFAAGVFHHIPFDEHAHWVKEAMRVTKQGGYFVLFELNPYNLGTQWIFNRSPIEHNAHMLTPLYAQRLFKKYDVIHIKYYAFFPRWLSYFQYLEPKLEAIPLGALYAVIVQKA